ncbi:hypothetical protein AB0C87_24890 [Actinomadura sp. NPDC048021]|uniref:hypothetical protein n=1 Tax=Actinomadura sp. NPDC048021 TaxID=3155385 RepID=UPI0033E160A8
MELHEIVETLEGHLAPLFKLMEIAEEEIEAAQKRFHEPVGEGDGPIWNSFILLPPSHPEMKAESLYRAHCRELLDRRGRGEDTRPATGAELIFALSEASLQAPLSSAAAGLYLKLGLQCFPEIMTDVLNNIGRSVGDYERLHGRAMAEHERYLRKKMRQDWRTKED